MHYRAFFLASLAIAKAVPSPYVTVANDNGVWWFQQGDKKFVSMGVNHVNNGGQDDGVGGRESTQCKAMTGSALCGDTLSFGKGLDYAPYYNVTMAIYGSEEAWAESAVARLAKWNFNTIGGWSSRLVEGIGAKRGLFYAHLLDIGTTWLNHDGLDLDIWSSAFVDRAHAIAARECAPRANDTQLLGYQLDNELLWKNLTAANLALSSYLCLHPSPGFKKALSFIQDRYNHSLQLLNEAWSIKATVWSDTCALLSSTVLHRAAVKSDSYAWLSVVAEQYFKVAHDAIRRYDSNHLILGIRGQFGYPQAPGILKALAPYIDVFDWHGYEDIIDGGYCTGTDTVVQNYIEEVHVLTGKPILVGEFSFTAADSNLRNTWGARACVDEESSRDHHGIRKPTVPCRPGCPFTTQEERAAAFTRYVTKLMDKPYAVGYHWWQWADEPTRGRWPDGENSNYGLVHLDDDDYSIVTKEMSKTNAAIPSRHSASFMNRDANTLYA